MLERGWSIRELRAQIGAGPGVVDRWLYGDGRPRGEFSTKLDERFGIPAGRWYESPAQPFAPPVAA